MYNIWFLENINLFQKQYPHKFKAYKNLSNFDFYKNKEYIYFSEDSANKIFLIENGKIKIGYYTEKGEEVIKAILTKGELFGEKAILGQEKRNEFAQSIDNQTTIRPIKVVVVHELMRSNQNLTTSIYMYLNWRFNKLERRLELLLCKDSKQRALAFFEDLKKEYGHCCLNSGNIIVKHPYTQKDIACLIGTSRPTLNIIMNRLKEEGSFVFYRNEFVFQKKKKNVR